jgi:8-oxo-dGTP pyrophosphatase MutT (NUDIX family)
VELTRHFVATVYVVNEGATALHHHDKLEMWLPPGGHVDRGETPVETARREVREETGLDVELLAEPGPIESDTVRELPEPDELLLEDIDVCDGELAHQHVDSIYFGRASDRAIDPAPGEAPAAAWEWYDRDRLREDRDRLEPDVVELGLRAIDAVGEA